MNIRKGVLAGNKEIVKQAIAAGANPNREWLSCCTTCGCICSHALCWSIPLFGWIASLCACCCGHSFYDTDPNCCCKTFWTPLGAAVNENDLEMVRALLAGFKDSRADVNKEFLVGGIRHKPVTYAIVRNVKPEIIESLINYEAALNATVVFGARTVSLQEYCELHGYDSILSILNGRGGGGGAPQALQME
jgi:hypothetical protein